MNVHDKIFTLLVYALVGIGLCLWPIYVKPQLGWPSCYLTSVFWPPLSARIRLLCALIILLIGLKIFGGIAMAAWFFNFLLLSFMMAKLGGEFNFPAMLASFSALVVSITVPWWSHQNGLLTSSLLKKIAFDLIVLIFFFLLNEKISKKKCNKTFIFILIFGIPAAILSFTTGILTYDNAWATEWHHWGAYIGPAESLLTGTTIFRDFPAQYGLGPTVLIGALCGADCWRAMYFIVSSTTLIYSVLIALMCLVVGGKNWVTRIAILILSLISCFLFTAYPPDVALPTATPSVGGLRFLPALLLVAYLFFSKNIEKSKLRTFGAHLLWVFGVLWSPESAFYVTFIWWSYYLFVYRLSSRSKFATTLVNLSRLLAIGIGFGIVFTLVFFIIYRELPALYGILAYVINPPGPMPINMRGAVWYFVFALVLSLGSLLMKWKSSGDDVSFRRGYLTMLLCYAVFSYFLGRSHDNNLLNITPFILLMLLSVVSNSESVIFSKAASTLVATFAGWLLFFGWGAFNQVIRNEGFIQFQPNFMLDSATLQNQDSGLKIMKRFERAKISTGFTPDAVGAMDEIKNKYGEPYTVLDFSMCLEYSAFPMVWSAIQNPANFTYIPSNRRKEFLIRSANSLNKSGWLIVDRNFPADVWLADYDSAYDRTGSLDFGSYYAIRFSPKKLISHAHPF